MIPPTAYLLIWSNGGVENLPLGLGTLFDVKISKERYCVGYFDPNSREWSPCEHKRSGGVVCSECGFRSGQSYIPHTCSKDSKSCRAYCFTPHSVYMALIADVPKVGVTRFSRRYERFFESGANEARLILLEENRAEAVDIERTISTKFRVLGVREHVRITKRNIVPFLRTPTKERLASFSTLSQEIARWLTKERYKVPKLEVLDDSVLYYPSTKEIDSRVQYAETSERISGEIVSLKGSIAVLEDQEGLKAFELDSLRGRIIEGST